jgi:dTDP-glucose 4,6-dehydratase
VSETGWKPQVGFEKGPAGTVAWYRDHSGWVERVKSGEYRNWHERNYADRGTLASPGR